MKYSTLHIDTTQSIHAVPCAGSIAVILKARGSRINGRRPVSRLLGTVKTAAAWERLVIAISERPVLCVSGWTMGATRILNRAVRITFSDRVEVIEADAVKVTRRRCTKADRYEIIESLVRSNLSVDAWRKLNPNAPARSTLYRWLRAANVRRTLFLVA
jgi:hypothetical protein